MVGARPFSDLPKIMANIEKRAKRALRITVQEVALTTHSKAIRTTRVDTGVARSNWIMTLGSPFTGVIPAYRPGKMRGIGERANANAARKQGLGVIRRYKVESEQIIYITNNTPYIGFLNDGSATISPPGMMREQAVQAGCKKIAPTFRRAFKRTLIDTTVR